MKYLEDKVRTSSGKCISFEPRKKQDNYVKILNGVDGCYSNVGRVNKSPQIISLSTKDKCLVKEIIVHEFMHTLGKFDNT